MKLKLNKPNELKFSLAIEGISSDSEDSEPTKARFLITESKTGMSVAFPMSLSENGTLAVNVPSLSQVFQEGSDYTGEVEVIVGNRIFNPTTVQLEFRKEIVVTATPVLTEDVDEEESVDVDAVIKPQAPSAPKKAQAPINEKVALDALFTARSRPVVQPAPVKPEVKKRVLSPEQQATKNELKSLIAEAWVDFE
jgi:hypothetical protein